MNKITKANPNLLKNNLDSAKNKETKNIKREVKIEVKKIADLNKAKKTPIEYYFLKNAKFTCLPQIDKSFVFMSFFLMENRIFFSFIEEIKSLISR